MYPEVSIWLAIILLIAGLVGLAWSSDVFVDGSSALAKALGVSPFLIGMVIIGFGTSAPEMIVSCLSGISGHSELSLGNAYGSCIFNIAFIIGIAALINPIHVAPNIRKVAIPLLLVITFVAWGIIGLGRPFTRWHGTVMLALFLVAFIGYSLYDRNSSHTDEIPQERASLGKSIMMVLTGLIILVGSSHILVWGAVDIAKLLGISELAIGLTVVAIGTSLPEAASAVAAARKHESDLVLGNIVGSNIFNTLAVSGLAGTLSPYREISNYVIYRDMPVLIVTTLSLGFFSMRRHGQEGRITRIEGGIWIAAFAIYFLVMLFQEMN